MATIQQLLEELNTKEAAVSTADLATELKASKEATLKQLKREKDKGNVDGNSEEGWLITDAGRKALEKGPVHPTMIDEGVTPRQQFEAIGHRIGIKEDRIILATDIVWSGDYNDIKWVWEALGQADIADDLRKVWVNSWRAKLQKGIPAELETELTGVPAPGADEGATGEAVKAKVASKDYIIVDDQPVRVGVGLGDFGLQDAKDILAIRALKARFGTPGTAQLGGQPPISEKVSEILTALEPYVGKGGNLDTLKEILADKLELQRREILSHIPQNPTQPRTFVEQLTDFTDSIGKLKDAGPIFRSILGLPEPSTGAPLTTTPIQLTDKEGKPVVMDIGSFINLKKFEGEEKRAEEDHKTKQEMAGAFKDFLTKIGNAAARMASR